MSLTELGTEDESNKRKKVEVNNEAETSLYYLINAVCFNTFIIVNSKNVTFFLDY